MKLLSLILFQASPPPIAQLNPLPHSALKIRETIWYGYIKLFLFEVWGVFGIETAWMNILLTFLQLSVLFKLKQEDSSVVPKEM